MRVLIAAALVSLAAHVAIADVSDEVRCREIGFSKAAERKDMKAFRSFIDADARFVGGSVLRGVDDIAAGWSVFFGENSPSIVWRPQIVEVLENGTLALSRGPYRVRSTAEDGSIVEEWGTFNSVWRLNDDGQWRVVLDAGSPAASPPADATQLLLDAEDNCPTRA
jgi:ketosteroid isomerase-like protein